MSAVRASCHTAVSSRLGDALGKGGPACWDEDVTSGGPMLGDIEVDTRIPLRWAIASSLQGARLLLLLKFDRGDLNIGPNRMIRYWWVNHKQTIKEEVSGSYLWSPQTEARGKRSQFYDNMRAASLGDLVLSYANGKIKYIGVVQDFAKVVPKPPSFRDLGKNWGDIGWLLPVAWIPLQKPIRPADHLLELAPLLPRKYSPLIRISGKGSQKAYLTEISLEVFSLLAPTSWSSADVLQLPETEVILKIDDALQGNILADQNLDATTKQQLILARYGQGKFRSQVMARYSSCVLTGVSSPSLLVASHIKPWRACSSSGERLDGENGLLMAPHVDRLFDQGLLTFDDQGAAQISVELAAEELDKLGLSQACSKHAMHFSDATRMYLDFHRRNVFRS
jgi:putative restriction endonuclease